MNKMNTIVMKSQKHEESSWQQRFSFSIFVERGTVAYQDVT